MGSLISSPLSSAKHVKALENRTNNDWKQMGTGNSHKSSTPSQTMESFIPESSGTSTLVKDGEPLEFVGNVTLPAKVLSGHQNKITDYYTREEFMEIMHYHRLMASNGSGQNLTADHSTNEKGAVCSKELQRKRGGTSESIIAAEPPQKKSWEDGKDDIGW